MPILTSFLKGSSYLFTGFKLIFQPGLRRFIILPVCTNIVLFTLLFIAFIHYIGIFNIWIESHLPTWLGWLGMIVWLLFCIGYFLLFIYTFATLANILGAPFNNLLAEKTEIFLTHQSLPEQSWTALIKDIPRVIGRQLGIVLYFIPRAFLILIIFLIPVIHIIASPLWFLFCCWLMCFTYLDYPTDNHRLPLKKVRAWMNDHTSLSLGFGIIIFLGTMIPLLNILVMPAAVCGATKMWVDENPSSVS